MISDLLLFKNALAYNVPAARRYLTAWIWGENELR